jgi:hypothetical protein
LSRYRLEQRRGRRELRRRRGRHQRRTVDDPRGCRSGWHGGRGVDDQSGSGKLRLRVISLVNLGGLGRFDGRFRRIHVGWSGHRCRDDRAAFALRTRNRVGGQHEKSERRYYAERSDDRRDHRRVRTCRSVSLSLTAAAGRRRHVLTPD